MGHYLGPLKLRSTLYATAADVIGAFQEVESALTGCGMLRVSDADYPGQAGTFVTGTAGVGETTVDTPSSSNNFNIGFKVYKHPTLSLYIQIAFYECQYGATSCRYPWFRFSIGTEVVDGVLNAAKQTPFLASFFDRGSLPATNSSTTNTTIPYTSVPLAASCGDDHFWLCAGGSILQSKTNGYAHYPDQVSVAALGLFVSDSDPDVILLMMPPPATISTVSYGMYAATDYGFPCSRYWLCDHDTWTEQLQGSAGYIQDPQNNATEEGLLIARASKIVRGSRFHFNLGFVTRASVTDGQLLTADVTGEGPSPYRVCPQLGPSSPTVFTTVQPTDYCTPILPWAS